jgi:hypothetical protein
MALVHDDAANVFDLLDPRRARERLDGADENLSVEFVPLGLDDADRRVGRDRPHLRCRLLSQFVTVDEHDDAAPGVELPRDQVGEDDGLAHPGRQDDGGTQLAGREAFVYCGECFCLVAT